MHAESLWMCAGCAGCDTADLLLLSCCPLAATLPCYTLRIRLLRVPSLAATAIQEDLRAGIGPRKMD